MNSSQILYKIKKYKKLQNTSLNGGNYNKIQYKINKYENMLGGELTQDDIEKVSADVKGILETVKDSSSMLGKSIFSILSNIDELKKTIAEMSATALASKPLLPASSSTTPLTQLVLPPDFNSNFSSQTIIPSTVYDIYKQGDPTDFNKLKQIIYVVDTYLNINKSKDELIELIKPYGTINNYFTLVRDKLLELINSIVPERKENIANKNSIIKNVILRLIETYYIVTTDSEQSTEMLKNKRKLPENKLDIKSLYDLLSKNQRGEIRLEISKKANIAYDQTEFETFMTKNPGKLPTELLLLGGDAIKMLNYKNFI